MVVALRQPKAANLVSPLRQPPLVVVLVALTPEAMAAQAVAVVVMGQTMVALAHLGRAIMAARVVKPMAALAGAALVKLALMARPMARPVVEMVQRHLLLEHL